MAVKYAVYPGTVATYDEEGNTTGDVTWTALDLATAYGVQDEPYLTVSVGSNGPTGVTALEYIHLKPRADGKYIDMKAEVEDVYLPDFDASKRWTNETDPMHVDKEIDDDLPKSQRISGFN